MKKILLSLFVLYASVNAWAQPFGNEWIDYNQVHYRIKVVNDGLYRIPYSVLAANIPNITSLNPAFLAMYHNGNQVPIYVSATGNFTPNDYIEFYGKRNIGDVDTFLYKSASEQAHPYHSLFTDTAIYFLTIRPSGNNARIVLTPNILTNLPPKEEFYMATQRLVNRNRFYSGKYYSVGSDEVHKSLFETGEGYVASAFFGSVSSTSPPQVTTQPYVFNLSGLYAAGPPAVLRPVYITNSTEQHSVKIDVNNSNVFTQTNYGFSLNRPQINLPLSQLTNTNNTVTYYTQDNAVSRIQNAVCMTEIEYPRNFSFDGTNSFLFSLASSPTVKYLEISNFNDNGLQPLLYDITNGIAIRSTQPVGSSILRFALPPSTVKRELLLVSGAPSTYTVINQMNATLFENFNATAKQGNYIIITHNSLLRDSLGNSWVEQYRAYRDIDNSPLTGKYQAIVVNIDTLYDQFAYGVRKSPLAIRNFIQYALANWSIRPQYVLLLGKAREYPDIRNNINANNQCLVPTFGDPGSDNLLACKRGSDQMDVAIGRLAIRTPSQVKHYLDKVKQYEQEQYTYTANQAITPKLWQKQLLHFSGGTSSFEQVVFRQYVNNYERIARDTMWGANVTTFTKTNNNPIDESLSQVIKSRINEGVSLLTFFGHSSTGSFDFSIDEPANYTNFGKYPLMLSNGCFTGLIHAASTGYSENFVLLPDKGAIGFIATTNLSVSTSLNTYSQNFYRRITNQEYTGSVGKALQSTFTEVNTCCSTSNFDMMVAYEMTLHGDPAIQINQYPRPDYAIEPSSVYFEPATITPGLDSFEVRVIVHNLGRAVKDSIAISLKRTLFDASNNPVVYNYKIRVPAPYYIDTFGFKLPTIISVLGYGQNTFEVYVDADFEITEMAEQNNGLLSPVSIFIQRDDVIPVYPYEFAIVPTQGVTLKASTVNPFAPLRNYLFQIDTSELFVNPLQTGSVLQTGGVLHFTPTITYKDSTVYYWRVAIDSSSPAWHYSSFIYLKDEYPGWNQSHYFQWKKDSYLNLRLDNDRIFKYPPTVNTIKFRTGNNIPWFEMGWEYNNVNMHAWRMSDCGYLRGLTFAVIDSLTGLPWESRNQSPLDNWGDKFQNFHCSNKYFIQYGFDFATTGTHPLTGLPWSDMIKRFIDSIPTGHFVLVYSTNNPPYTQWDTTLVTALQDIGFPAALLNSGVVNGPVVYMAQKNTPWFVPKVAYQNGYTPVMDTTFTFVGSWFQGSFSSTKIGPAVEWGSMHWDIRSIEQPSTDKDTVDIFGIQPNGQEILLFSTTQFNNQLTSVSAQQYPYIRLRLRTNDPVWRTAGQLNYWRVLYKKPPEAAINPSAHFVFTDSLQLGGKLKVEIGLESLTELPMDSMLAKFTIRDAALNITNAYIRHSPLPGLDTIVLAFDAPINGASFQGLNRLIIEANPDDDQPEQYHFNNIAEISFKTIGDNVNPLLDVTFDGQRIFNGDIVSSRPNILITLKDDNPFLALNDTSLVEVFIRYPGESAPRRMAYDGTVMKFYPADSTNLVNNNRAQVELNPEFLIDGRYELIVKDRDRSNNNSSTVNRFEGNLFYDYKTAFEVINKPMITNVLNYPNPFTTSTRFIFTVTGSKVPDNMMIQIMTIKGTVVREITKDELGPIRIGRNISQYAWDGRDQYGDLLANGVYFYRVTARLDDKPMDRMNQTYDRYFKRGFGKLVIVR